MLEGGSFKQKLNFYMPILSDQKDKRATSPSPKRLFFPKDIQLKFEIATLFGIVENFKNCAFGDYMSYLGIT